MLSPRAGEEIQADSLSRAAFRGSKKLEIVTARGNVGRDLTPEGLDLWIVTIVIRRWTKSANSSSLRLAHALRMPLEHRQQRLLQKRWSRQQARDQRVFLIAT